MRSGRFLNTATAQLPAVVLGAESASRLGIQSAAGGPLVDIGGHRFTVVGILDTIPLAPDIDRAALVGYPVAKRLFGIDEAPSTVRVRTDPARVTAVRSVLAATADPLHPSQVDVTRPSDALAAKAEADNALTALLLGLGAVALVVGGVGIANTMVISVLERRSEIGLRRALGATRGNVRSQFLVEAVLLSALGGGAGVTLGAGVTATYAAARGWTPTVPLAAVGGAVVLTLVLGAVAGLYPAGRAARFAPAEALHPA